METETLTLSPIHHSIIPPRLFTILTKPHKTMSGLFTQEKLRVGYPELCPAPCRAVQFQEGLQIQVDDFTSLLDLKVISITTIGRVHLLDTDQTIQPTLLVTVRNTDPEGEKWGEQAKDVYKTLCQEGLPGLMVEIAGEEFDRLPSYFPPFEQDRIAIAWERVLREVFALNLQGIYVFACFRIGYSDDIHECPPTISVSVDHKCDRNWDEFHDQMKQLLCNLRLSDTEILITKDRDPRHINTSGSSFSSNKPNMVAPGDEISRAGFLGTGTMGGCVQLLMPDKDWTTYLLTAAHVASSSHPNRPDPESHETSTNSITMECPPTEALRLEKAKRIRQIKSLEKEINSPDDETALLAREMLPLSKQTLIHATQQLDKRLNSLGTVKYQSDLITVPCPPKSLRMMDWALISPSPSISYSNNITAGGELEDLATLQKFIYRGPQEMDLFMIGAKSKITPVYYNRCRVALVHSEIIDGKEHFVPTLEHCLGPRSPAAYASKHGDSGALVFTEQGWVVGMVIGGQGVGPIAYFTASNDLREHILETTGAVDFRLLPTK